MEHLAELMPLGPFMFSPQAISDQPLSVLLAELVREAAIRRTFQELPHAVEAIVEEIEHPRDGLVRVRALLSGWRPSRRRGSSSARVGA